MITDLELAKREANERLSEESSNLRNSIAVWDGLKCFFVKGASALRKLIRRMYIRAV
ncbi:UNVERIFIED_ORG: hypothetical protein GGI63_003790 [Rhizobium esperanzae]